MTTSKAATLHLVRHAQGYHNLGAEFHGMVDPRLTPLGEEQCTALRDALGASFQSRIHLVTASPLSRTLHTASIAFGPALRSEKGICKKQILAIPDAQEISDFPCDCGSDPDVLAAACKEHNWPADLSLVKPGWNKKTLSNRWSPMNDAIVTRARDARRLIRRQVQQLRDQGVEAPEIALVSHGGYLHYLTNDWENSCVTFGTGWRNCETRSYAFEDESTEDNDEAFLVETKESRRSRGLDYPMFGREKQKELFVETMQGWEVQGLQTPVNVGKGQGKEKEARTETEDNMDEIRRTLSGGSQVKVSA